MIINGTDLYIFINDALVAYSTAYTISIEMDARERTNKGTGLWRTYGPGLLDVSASCNGLFAYGSGASQLYDAMILRLPVKLEFGQQTTGPVLDMLYDYYKGNFIITSFENTAGDTDNATYSASFKHSSAFEKVLATIPEPVDIGGYYVSTTGDDDTGDGSFANPWATWQKGFSELVAGDTLYIRGGTYQPSGTINDTSWIDWYGGVALNGVNGTAVNRITVSNYPGETPILNGASITQGGASDARACIFMRDCEYWTLRGLTVTGVVQIAGQLGVVGIRIQEDSHHFILDRVVSHDNGGSGISFVYDCDDTLILNCDSYNNIDPLSSPTPYNNSDGIEIAEITHEAYTNTIRGCRVWGNCDDGVDLFDNEGIVTIDRCWAFNNMKPAAPYDTNGIKLGRTNNSHGVVRRIVTNSIAWGNQADGFTTGGDAYCDINLFNNIAVTNNYGYQFYLTTPADIGTITMRNCAAYGNADDFRSHYAAIVHDHNCYDADFTPAGPVCSSADFRTALSSQLQQARQSDGSLPRIDFLHLLATSDLIAAGVNVGLATDGDGDAYNATPSIGAFEYK